MNQSRQATREAEKEDNANKRKRSIVVPDEEFDGVWERTFEALRCSTLQELGAFLNIGKAAVWNVKEKRRYPWDWIAKLHLWYGINTDWLLNGKGPKVLLDKQQTDAVKHGKAFLVKTARLKGISDSGELIKDDEDPLYISKHEVENLDDEKGYLWMTVLDNSMEPEVIKGDKVIIDPARTELEIDGFFVFGVGKLFFIRKPAVSAGDIVIGSSENPNEMNLDLLKKKNIKVAGKIVGLIRVL